METPATLTFEAFWGWLTGHPNCILRAGTPEAVLYDDDDLHWLLAQETAETYLVQLLRGKRLMGELVLAPDQVSYVQATIGDAEGEHVFELISESETDAFAAFFFVLAHAFDVDDEAPGPGRVH